VLNRIAHLDGDILAQFQVFLESFERDTKDKLGALHSELRDLASGPWQDDNSERYLDMFEALMYRMSCVDKLQYEFIPKLKKYIALVDEYAYSRVQFRSGVDRAKAIHEDRKEHRMTLQMCPHCGAPNVNPAGFTEASGTEHKKCAVCRKEYGIHFKNGKIDKVMK